jgi:hypothetical protein
MRRPYAIDCRHRFGAALTPDAPKQQLVPHPTRAVVAWLSPDELADILRWTPYGARAITADGTVCERPAPWPLNVPPVAEPPAEDVATAAALLRTLDATTAPEAPASAPADPQPLPPLPSGPAPRQTRASRRAKRTATGG